MLPGTSILQVVLALGAASLLACLPIASGACQNGDVPACPAHDEITPLQDGYDAASVDWNAVVADIYAITDAEPRICTMSIRAWFHDVGGHQPAEGVVDGLFRERHFPSIAGSDASIITHIDETMEPASANHGFAQVVRHVLVQLAAAHGVSHADLLTLFAAKCPDRMGGTVDIPSHCEASGFPLYVGKADYKRPDVHPNYSIHTARADQLPQSHTRTPGLYHFLIDFINDQVPEARWKITQTDATALMGAHGIMMTQNCMTNGQQPDTPPDMADRTCSGDGGRQRMFHWSNHYWQDLTSGQCEQNAFDKAGRDLTAQEDADFTQCSWNSMEGFELGEILECSAMSTVESSGDVSMTHERNKGMFSKGWKSGRWFSDPEQPEAPCCGYTCQTCEENADSKFWCGGNMLINQGIHRFFPYGYLDCDLNRAYRFGNNYCNEPEGDRVCKQGNDPERMGTIGGLMDKYRGSASAWEEDFAVAFCKYSNFGANYTDSKASFSTLSSGGPSSGCVNPTDILSPKSCTGCQITGRDPDDLQMGTVSTPVVQAPPPIVDEEDDEAEVPVEVVDTTTADDGATADVESTEEEPLNVEPKTVTTSAAGSGGDAGGGDDEACGSLCKFMAAFG